MHLIPERRKVSPQEELFAALDVSEHCSVRPLSFKTVVLNEVCKEVIAHGIRQ